MEHILIVSYHRIINYRFYTLLNGSITVWNNSVTIRVFLLLV